MRPLLIVAVGIFALGCNYDTFEAAPVAPDPRWRDSVIQDTVIAWPPVDTCTTHRHRDHDHRHAVSL